MQSNKLALFANLQGISIDDEHIGNTFTSGGIEYGLK